MVAMMVAVGGTLYLFQILCHCNKKLSLTFKRKSRPGLVDHAVVYLATFT